MAGGPNTRSSARANVDLPQPDSPTRPCDLAPPQRQRHVVDDVHQALRRHVVDAQVLHLEDVGAHRGTTGVTMPG